MRKKGSVPSKGLQRTYVSQHKDYHKVLSAYEVPNLIQTNKSFIECITCTFSSDFPSSELIFSLLCTQIIIFLTCVDVSLLLPNKLQTHGKKITPYLIDVLKKILLTICETDSFI